MRNVPRWLLPIVTASALLLAACGQETLFSKLSETEANEMVAVLKNAGMSATKVDGGETGWSITTAPSEFAKAVEVLHAQGYPREQFASLGTVFKKEGFVSSQVEERARLLFGLSQELSHTVSAIDGVVQARVHLALPETSPMSEKTVPPSASVFIKHRPGFAMDANIGKVKALVVNSVEGLSYERVTVVTFPAQPLPSAAESERAPVVANLAWIALLGALAVAASFLWPALRRRQLRRNVRAARLEARDLSQ